LEWLEYIFWISKTINIKYLDNHKKNVIIKLKIYIKAFENIYLKISVKTDSFLNNFLVCLYWKLKFANNSNRWLCIWASYFSILDLYFFNNFSIHFFAKFFSLFWNLISFWINFHPHSCPTFTKTMVFKYKVNLILFLIFSFTKLLSSLVYCRITFFIFANLKKEPCFYN